MSMIPILPVTRRQAPGCGMFPWSVASGVGPISGEETAVEAGDPLLMHLDGCSSASSAHLAQPNAQERGAVLSNTGPRS